MKNLKEKLKALLLKTCLREFGEAQLAEDVSDMILTLIQSEIKSCELRDAYKLPFSDNEIEQCLNPAHRAERETANEWYRKGRDDENKELITNLKEKGLNETK